jgi:hypothetical protein
MTDYRVVYIDAQGNRVEEIIVGFSSPEKARQLLESEQATVEYVREDNDEPFTTPCELCTGNSACYVLDNGVRRPQTSAEWCAEMKVCAATIEWDRLAEENQGY